MNDPKQRHRKAAVVELSARRAEEAVEVLCESFYDYPVMRYLLGSLDESYDERLRSLIRFFVAARVLREGPVLGVEDGDSVAAAALVTLPIQPEAPPELYEHRDAVWRELGDGARQRYETLGEVWKEFPIRDPQHHLNMIGVRRGQGGRGLGRLLLESVHRMADRDPGSAGVSLTTEDPANVSLYEHFGYRVVDHRKITDGLETWGLFRAR